MYKWPALSPGTGAATGGVTGSYLQIGSIVIKVNAPQVEPQAERGRAGGA